MGWWDPWGINFWTGLEFLPISAAHSLLLSMFLKVSLTTFAISPPSIPLSTSFPPLPLFLISTFYFLLHPSTLYSLQSPPPLSKAIPDVAVWAPIAFCHFFFSTSVTGSGPLWKKGKGEQRKRVERVQGSTVRGKIEMYCHISSHMRGTCWNVGTYEHIFTHAL